MKTTKDYKQLKFLATNRSVDKLKVARLAESIKKRNLLRYQPVLVNEKKEVIDGQHRILAAQECGVEIYFNEIKGLAIDEARILNENNTSWRIDDYVLSFSMDGNEEYKKIISTAKKQNLTISLAALMLSLDVEKTHPRTPVTVIKSGAFQVKDEETTKDFLRVYNLARETINNTCVYDRDFVRALWRVYKNEEVDVGELLEKIKTRGVDIKRSVNTQEYLRQFEDVLNAGLTHKTRLY